MTSLRSKMLLSMAVLLSLVGIVSSAATYHFVRKEAVAALDLQIQQVAEFVSKGSYPLPQASSGPSAADDEDLFQIEVWDAEKNLVRSSLSRDTPLAPPEHTGFRNLKLPDGKWRSYSIVSPDTTVRVSMPIAEPNEIAFDAAAQISVPLIVILPLSWLMLGYILDRIMGRLNRIADDLAGRGPRDTTPISTEGVPDEIQPFVQGMNALVERARDSAERQKQFVANAAHELRSPLTAISLQIDNLRAVARSPKALSRLKTLEAGSRRANDLVMKLLALARSDAPIAAGAMTTASLAETVSECARDFEPIANQRGVTLNLTCRGDIPVPRAELRTVLDVLVDNALRYAPTGSHIDLAAAVDGDRFGVAVIDEGPGIPAEKLPHVFERFYRASPQLAEGTGLGLSIARAVAERLGWQITLDNRRERTGVDARLLGAGSPTT
ncbi:MAG: ATP-binding protein [Hyphomicrobiales bacterium]